MEEMNLFGIPVWYENQAYGAMERDSIGGKAYLTYHELNPAFLEVAAESLSLEHFIQHVKELLALAEEPENWDEVRHTFGWDDDEDKNEALQNTRELLEQILDNIEEAKPEEKKNAA